MDSQFPELAFNEWLTAAIDRVSQAIERELLLPYTPLTKESK